MRTKLKPATIIMTIATLTFLCCNNSSALDYQTSADVDFTINPSITVSLSSSDLVIDELSPGTSSDSNNIVVNVLTNNISGYYLSGTVGNSNDPYNTTSLTNTANNDHIFTSLNTSDSLVSLTTPGTWGYSYATTTTDDGNGNTSWNWSNYSGLPLYTNAGVKLSEKYTPSDDDISFKIAAYATNVQASGEYNNVINFTATAYPYPLTLSEAYAYFNKQKIDGYYTMQDMTPGICAVAEDNSTMQAIDLRDHNVYTVAKLADHRCWMTTNLNLEGGTQLSHEDTDIPEGYTLPTANGFQEGNKLPVSSTVGFSDGTMAYLYNSNRNDPSYCSEAPGCYSYYSWTTTTAGSGLEITTSNTDAPYSICPKGWHLPNDRYGTDDSSDFRAFIIALGGAKTITTYNSSTNPTGSDIYQKVKAGTIANYALPGYYNHGNFVAHPGVHYWSATSGGSGPYGVMSLDAMFEPSTTAIANGDVRWFGFSVRCIANNQ